MASGFLPSHWLLGGGHRQTLLGFWTRRRLRWTLPSEDLVVEAEEDVRLLARATWQDGPRAERPALVIVHGLGGSDASAYAVSTGRHAFARGWHVVRMNMRGAGDGEALCQHLYNAGLDTDLLAVVAAVARVTPRVAVAGFSLGASQALLALGRRRDHLPAALFGVAAVSPPLDLSACADALARPDNRLYQHYFMTALREAYRRRARTWPDQFEEGRERATRTVREYDEAITAYYGGYASAADYYAKSSAGPWLASIERPALILAAADDPMIPQASVLRWPLPASGIVRREVTPTGGHVGFVGRSAAPGLFWAAPRVLDFLEEVLAESGQDHPLASGGRV
jgi:hypothetical protein